MEFLISCSLSTSSSCLLSNAIICTQSSWSREARSKGNCFRNQALGLIQGQASNHQLWQSWAVLCSTGAHRYLWVHRAYMWCCQVFKSSVKQILFASSPNTSFFSFPSPISKPLLWNRALIFSIPNSRAGGIAKARYQVTGERVKTFGCSFVGPHRAYTQATIFISPHVYVKTLRKVIFSLSLSLGRTVSARKVPTNRGVWRLETGGRKNPVRIKKHLVHSTGSVVPTHLSYQNKAKQQVSTITMFTLNPLNG